MATAEDVWVRSQEHCVYQEKVSVAWLWHQARQGRGFVHVMMWVFPEDSTLTWENPAGIVDYGTEFGDEPEANLFWVDAETGMRTLRDAYSFGALMQDAVNASNGPSHIPRIVATNNLHALYERLDGSGGLQDNFMPYWCLDGIESPQAALNLFAGDQLHTMPYRDYLKTDHWQAIRVAAREAAGQRCQLCNSDGPVLDTHHRTYERRGFEDDGDVIVLCRNCHAKFHDKLR